MASGTHGQRLRAVSEVRGEEFSSKAPLLLQLSKIRYNTYNEQRENDQLTNGWGENRSKYERWRKRLEPLPTSVAQFPSKDWRRWKIMRIKRWIRLTGSNKLSLIPKNLGKRQAATPYCTFSQPNAKVKWFLNAHPPPPATASTCSPCWK